MRLATVVMLSGLVACSVREEPTAPAVQRDALFVDPGLSGPAPNRRFGAAVAGCGGDGGIVVGAPGARLNDPGSAFFFGVVGSSFQGDGGPLGLGAAVACDEGNWAVSYPANGAVFFLDSTGQDTLPAPTGRQAFGAAVALGSFKGKLLLAVGSPGESVLAGGALDVYALEAAGPRRILASAGSTGQQLGAAVAVGDLNRDGVLDVVAGAAGSSRLSIFFGAADAGFPSMPLSPATTFSEGQAIAIREGELVSGAPGLGLKGAVVTYAANGTNLSVGAGRQVPTSLAGFSFGSSLRVVDFDEDGFDDYVLGGQLTTQLVIFQGASLTWQERDFADAGVSVTSQFGRSLGLTFDSSGAPVLLVGAPSDSAERGRVLPVEQCAGLAPLETAACRLPCGAALSGKCSAGTCSVPTGGWPCGSEAACDAVRGVCKMDAGQPDAGKAPDGGERLDAGARDGGASDAGAGASDAGAVDAGAVDAGPPRDAGASDAGAPSTRDFTYRACGCSAGPLAPSALLAALLLQRRRRRVAR